MGLRVVAQVLVGVGHAVQGVGLAVRHAEFVVQSARLCTQGQGLPVVADQGVAVAEVVQRHGAQAGPAGGTEEFHNPQGNGQDFAVAVLSVGGRAAAQVHVNLAVAVLQLLVQVLGVAEMREPSG